MTTTTADTPTAYTLKALSHTRPVSERVVKASVPEKHAKDVPPALTALVDAGYVIADGPKTRRTYVLKDKQ